MKIWLDDMREAPEGWVRAWSAKEAIFILTTGVVEEISIDHDLGKKLTGYDVVKWIEKRVITQNYTLPKITIHSANPVGRKNIEAAIKRIEKHILNP